ncbi:MAG: twin-arginine translocation signal domain-containing protein [Actinobacteria bacterium]|nr:MAG: twin-arginine translocation signal domain-containing protein [Actinomycetota bacterium]
MRPAPITRRDFLVGVGASVGAGLVAAACSKGSPAPTPPGSASLSSMKSGATELSLLSTGSPQKPGPAYFGFGLVTNQGRVVTGGSPQVWLAKDMTSKPTGPFAATWFPFAPASDFNNTAPRSALPGNYAATIEVPGVGNWLVGVTLSQGSQRFFGQAALQGTDQKIPAELGSKAISVKTPVAHTLAGLKQICTRPPPDPMHYISLDKALTTGKPTVVTFATPLLCESMLCGPVVDEELLVYQKLGASKANFIHVEEFLPGPDLTPPPATLENQSPAFKAWGFQTEPWTIVIDGMGIIRARIEGPVTAPQIEAALHPLL